ncbi:hypothetical protein DV735_g1262, partial [Chaetothyriales sp. CBS 134920]
MPHRMQFREAKNANLEVWPPTGPTVQFQPPTGVREAKNANLEVWPPTGPTVQFREAKNANLEEPSVQFQPSSHLPQTTVLKGIISTTRPFTLTQPPLATELANPFTSPQFSMVLGRVAHYAFDAVLISAVLAGIKRSTGLTLKSSSFAGAPSGKDHSAEIQTWVDRYLGVGEWVVDQSIAIMGSSQYFERRR